MKLVNVITLAVWVTFIVQGSAIQIYRNDYISKNTATFIMMLIPIISTLCYINLILNKMTWRLCHIDKLIILSIIGLLTLFSTLFYFDILYPEWWPYLHF